MSKFHEEFFRKESPEHDLLVALTIEKLDYIFEQIKIRIIPWKEKREEPIFICHGIEGWCEGRTAHRKNYPFDCLNDGHGKFDWDDIDVDTLNISKNLNFCRNLKLRDGKEILHFFNEKLMQDKLKSQIDTAYQSNGIGLHRKEKNFKRLASVSPIINESKGEKILFVDNHKTHWEVEKLCKSENGFIIGYADIVVDFSVNVHWDVKLEEDWIWKNYEINNCDRRIVIECKPKLESWGGPLRQLKTYMELLDATYGVFSTFSTISQKVAKILESEKVFPITLTKNSVKLLV